MTEGHGHESNVVINVEATDLESNDWVVAVNLTDAPTGNDIISIRVAQVGCPENTILIEGIITDGMEYIAGDHNWYWLNSTCGATERQTWHQAAEGMVTFERANGEVVIDFSHLELVNTDTLPTESPGLISVAFNGEYRAPVYCVHTT